MVRPNAKNPNAPEHLPEVATDQTIIKAIAEKLFSEPDPEAAQVLNQSTLIYFERLFSPPGSDCHWSIAI